MNLSSEKQGGDDQDWRKVASAKNSEMLLLPALRDGSNLAR